MNLPGNQPPQPEQYNIAGAGRTLRCLICGYDLFLCREAQLNTAVATLFNLDWANKSAVCLICDQCGYIHWFLPS